MTGLAGEAETRVDFLLRRLVLLAGDVRDLLATGDWEGALPVQEEYDEAFAALTHLADRGQLDTARYANELTRLHHVHAENVRLAGELHASARQQLGQVTKVHQIGRAYSPLGANHRPSPRYVDGSA